MTEQKTGPGSQDIPDREVVWTGNRLDLLLEVAVVMGSQSDWPIMQYAGLTLDELGISYEARIVSAHRTPDRLVEFARYAEQRGFKAIIAGAGGAAHLPGMISSMTILPVLGCPMETHALKGVDSLHSIVQMPAGVPVATFAIGKAGVINAALHAAAILALFDPVRRERLREWRRAQTASVQEHPRGKPVPEVK